MAMMLFLIGFLGFCVGYIVCAATFVNTYNLEDNED